MIKSKNSILINPVTGQLHGSTNFIIPLEPVKKQKSKNDEQGIC